MFNTCADFATLSSLDFISAVSVQCIQITMHCTKTLKFKLQCTCFLFTHVTLCVLLLVTMWELWHSDSDDRGPRGGEQWRKKENNSDGHHGAKPERKHRTEAIGIIVSRPYAPAGAKKEGEGDAMRKQARLLLSSRVCQSHDDIVLKQIKLSSNIFLGLVARHYGLLTPHLDAKFQRGREACHWNTETLKFIKRSITDRILIFVHKCE